MPNDIRVPRGTRGELVRWARARMNYWPERDAECLFAALRVLYQAIPASVLQSHLEIMKQDLSERRLQHCREIALPHT